MQHLHYRPQVLSVVSKPLTVTPNLLDATLTKNRGESQSRNRRYSTSATKIISGEPSPIGVRSKSPYCPVTRNPQRTNKCSTSYRKKYRSGHANTSRS